MNEWFPPREQPAPGLIQMIQVVSNVLLDATTLLTSVGPDLWITLSCKTTDHGCLKSPQTSPLSWRRLDFFPPSCLNTRRHTHSKVKKRQRMKLPPPSHTSTFSHPRTAGALMGSRERKSPSFSLFHRLFNTPPPPPLHRCVCVHVSACTRLYQRHLFNVTTALHIVARLCTHQGGMF